uniref:Cold-regulated 413 plasma membrane protein 4-like n=1 Tax=Rhizophora mucronata TaxID=61149 RepID=A0A2P2JY26_RHIMU
MENWIEMGVREMAESLVYNASSASAASGLRSSRSLASFEWGGTISALFLLIRNQVGTKIHAQTTLLMLYLLISCPTLFFKILRGQFGYWIAFLAAAANLFYPQKFPVPRFILFVITPDWLADGLRDTIIGGVFGLLIGILVVITEIQGIGGFRNCECNLRCFCYCLGTAFLFFFTILHLCLGTW